MSLTSNQCPKCLGKMEQGFIANNPPLITRVLPGVPHLLLYWERGAPKKSLWKDTKESVGDVFAIGVFRCKSCGYLEAYARPEFEAK